MTTNTLAMEEVPLRIGADMKLQMDAIDDMSNSEIARRAKRKSKSLVLSTDSEEELQKPVSVIQVRTPADLMDVSAEDTRKTLAIMLAGIRPSSPFKIEPEELDYLYKIDWNSTNKTV